MFHVMIGFGKSLRLALGGLLASAGMAAAITEPATASYSVIIERNPFNLKPPEPVKPPEPPAPPPSTVKLTGITTILSSKRALLTVQEPGKPQPSQKIMREGERDGTLEVVEINEQAGAVKIINSGVSRTLTFETDGVTKPVAVVNPLPPGVGQPQFPGQPAPQPNPAVPTPVFRTSTGGPTGLGGIGGGDASATDAARQIPTRSVRVAPLTSQPAPTVLPGQYVPPRTTQPSPSQLSAEEQIILMEVNKTLNQGGPPLPPTPLSPRQ